MGRALVSNARLLVALDGIAALSAVLAASASAAPRVSTIAGFPAPGTPAELNKVTIVKQGSPKAKKILVLVPGTSAGATNFRPMANGLLKKLKGWQVWSIERRENQLEDHSMLEAYVDGEATNEQVIDYYLGWILSGTTPHFTPKTTAETQYAKDWGLNVAVQDIRRVVKAAGRKGRTVVLGGHSLGGSITTAYATWDFNGKPGARSLDGLVFIDGAGGGRDVPTPEDAQAGLDALKEPEASPFLDLLGLGLPWAAGVFNAMGSTAAVLDPDSPAAMYNSPLLPAMLKPPVLTTNLAQYGYAVDVDTSPQSLRLVQSHIGQLAASGDPRGWVDGELGSARRAATVFQEWNGMDGTSWYHPVRLSMDAGVVDNGNANPAQAVLGVKAIHGDDVRIPMYSFDAALGNGRIAEATRELAAQSRVPKKWIRTVNRASTYAHIDPLSADPAKNDFIKTLTPFLKRKIK